MSMTGKQWGLTLVGLLIVVPMAQFLGRSAAESQNAAESSDSESRMAAVGQDTKVIVSKQTSEGALNSDLNVEAAEKLGAYTLERLKLHTQRILDEMKSTDDVNLMSQKTVLLQSGDRNIAVTRIYASDKNFAIQFASIEGTELTRILCQSNDASRDVIIAGKCKDTVKKQFGFEMGGSI